MFPLYLYFFYIAYNKNVNKKENSLFFDFAILTSYYLIAKFLPFFPISYFFSFDILLFLTYVNKKDSSILILSILSIFYYYGTGEIALWLLFLEYGIYYLLYFMEKKNFYNFCYFFVLFKTFWLIVENHFEFIPILYFYLMIYLCYVIYQGGQEILKYHTNYKELEKEKVLYKSLFQITHEIKNPIAVCKGYLDMYDSENKKTKDYIPIVKKEIDRTLTLLEDFLSMNHIKIQKEVIDLNVLLEDIEEHFKLILKEKNIHFECQTTDDEVYIYADYNRLLQVFINLIKNSVESFEKRKDRYLKITLKLHKKQVLISIEDNGIGMKEETLQKIKNPFFTTKTRGTGLGVSLSNQIIEAHEGHLEYDSVYGEGTTVKLDFPLYEI